MENKIIIDYKKSFVKRAKFIGWAFFLCLLLLFSCGKQEASKSIKIDPMRVTLKVGESYKINATTQPQNPDWYIIWSSSDEYVVEVSSSGIVTAKEAGVSNVMAECSSNPKNCFSSCLIKVEN